MIKVFINPHYRNPDQADGGIRRVTSAMWRYLPEFGIQPTDDINEADVINNHGALLAEKQGVPTLCSNHGLFWSDYDWAAWAHETNVKVIETMRRAQAITAPSRWVAHAITRGMLRRPQVIYHGVEPDDFMPDPDPADWVLWNKARIDPVSSPEYLFQIAGRMPDVRFLATIEKRHEIAQRLDDMPNVMIVEPMPHEQMKVYVAKAALYLCTTRETFGIGTLEALAAGVPIVGWAYGGQEEIVKQDETGYLVNFGDYDQLEKAIRQGLANRKRLGRNARDDVMGRWLWPDKIEQYANVIKRVYEEWHNLRPADLTPDEDIPLREKCKVVVIVTNHNLGRFLPECLNSIRSQTMDNWRCIVVDDASTDGSLKIINEFCDLDDRFRWASPQLLSSDNQKNVGLCASLNHGFKEAQFRYNTKYVLNLDADNILEPKTLGILSEALDRDSSIHIAYGHLDMMSEDGSNRQRSHRGFPPSRFLWRGQMAHLNQIPSTCLMRREVLEETGGYRVRDWRNEDASLWCRATSFGFRARKVTELATFTYRSRDDSKSQHEHKEYGGEGDWCAWYPWKLAGSAKEGMKLRVTDDSPLPRPDLVPWGAQGHPPKDWQRKRFYWPVRHLQQPAISVIIPCGPRHRRFLLDALDSLVAQDFPEWEAIVINDTGDDWEAIQGAPYAKVITGKGDSKGAGASRNVGAAIARGETLLFLDADDYLLPGAMSAMWNAYVANEHNCVVYGDWLAGTGKPDSDMGYYKSYDFQCNAEHDDVVLRRIVHPVTALVPKWAHYKAQGFDEEMPVWEDWDYQIRIYGIIGLCGIRLEQALMVYRVHTGQRRKAASVKEAESGANHVGEMAEWAKSYLMDAHIDLYKGRKQMACSGCPGKAKKNQQLERLTQSEFAEMMTQNGDAMILKYHGPGLNKITIKGPASNKGYRVMNSPHGRLLYDVHPEDAEILTKRTRKGEKLYTEFKEMPKPQEVTVKPPQAARVGIPDAPVQDWALPKLTDGPDAPVFEEDERSGTFDVPVADIVDITSVTWREAKSMIENADMPTLIAWQQAERSRKPNPRKSVIGAINKRLSNT